ncbi:unnamed protein product [Callosobruchus maculatus]|uniref:Uncharacterized protein n=1 Tax=Callosobruchus maculatus TaxID=64391 RepID=A0A653DKN1_CALMS|nr:unnamed protein product [Callosobruchus maculatus]
MINRLEECILHLQHIISSAHKEQLHRLYQAYLYEKNCNHSLIQYYQYRRMNLLFRCSAIRESSLLSCDTDDAILSHSVQASKRLLYSGRRGFGNKFG